MNRLRHNENQVPLRRVVIQFGSDWKTITRVVIEAECAAPANCWPYSNEKTLPLSSIDSCVAFLAAVTSAAVQGMRVGADVADGAIGSTLYSLKPGRKWSNAILQFGDKFAFRHSFEVCGRPKPGEESGVVVRLRVGFDVEIRLEDKLSNNYEKANARLREMFSQIKETRRMPMAKWATGREKRHNLPAARCDTFINRPGLQDTFIEALRSERSIIWIYGENGAGKAEFIRHSLVEKLSLLPFDQLIWIDIQPSDAVAPLGLREILATVADALQVPMLLPADTAPDLRAATAELARLGALLVIHHFDAVTDLEILPWLRSLRTSKAVVIDCCPPPDSFELWCKQVKVPPMNLEQRTAFLHQRLQEIPPPPLPLRDVDVERLLQIAGGNPARIGTLVGLLRADYSLAELEESTLSIPATFVPGAFERMSSNAQLCLMALSLFPYGATTNQMHAVTALGEATIRQAVRQLLGFVDFTRDSIDSPARQSLADPATGKIVRRNLESRQDDRLFRLKQNWYSYFEQVAENVDFCWDDISKLKLLDMPMMAQTICYCLRTAFAESRWDTVIKIGRGCRYWQYVRGDWLFEDTPIGFWTEAARRAGNIPELFDALVYQLNIRAKQAAHSTFSHEAAERLLATIQNLQIDAVCRTARLRLQHARALLLLATGSYQAAENLWIQALRQRPEAHDRSAMKRWLATCLLKQKRHTEARNLFLRHVAEVDGLYERSALMSHLNLIEIDLSLGNRAASRARRDQIEQRIVEVGDMSFLADFDYLTAQLLPKGPDWDSAMLAAREGYHRLGKNARVDEIDASLKKGD